MKSKKSPLILLVFLAVIVTISGTVLAYMFSQTTHIRNEFKPALVSCDVVETIEENQKTSIKVENTGNVEAYVRVRLVAYWIDEENNLTADKPSPVLDFEIGDNWLKGEDDTYYYCLPLKPGPRDDNTHLTKDNLLKTPITLQEEDGYKLVVEVAAEAIQSKPKDAISESWQIDVLDDNSLSLK